MLHYPPQRRTLHRASESKRVSSVPPQVIASQKAQATDLGWTVSIQVCLSGAEGKVHVCGSHIYVKDLLSPPCHNETMTIIYREIP